MELTRFVGKSDAARVKLGDGRPLKSILKKPKGSSQVKNMGVGLTVDYVTCNQPCGSKLDSNVSSRSRSNDTTKSVSIVGTSEAKRKVSMKATNIVWEVDTNLASPIKAAWHVDGVMKDVGVAANINSTAGGDDGRALS
ncbi:hypothetical protein Tco_0032411 [Tanacetum coccineum]